MLNCNKLEATFLNVFIFIRQVFLSVNLSEKRRKMKLLWVVMLVIGTVFADDDDKKENVGTVVGIDLGTTYSW